jgi:exonuclease SbcC
LELERLGQVTLIEGENGAGKTSILDALCVCLYGRTLRTSGNTKSGYLQLHDLINHSSINADIEVEFENHGHNYLVAKQIPGGSETQLSEDGLVKAIGADEVMHYIERVAIGLDWEAFSKSSVILQGEMGALSQLTPNQRKETLKKLFGLEKYDDYAGIAKVKQDEAKRSIDILESANDTLALDIAKIPETKRKIDETKKDLGILQMNKERAESDLKRATATKDALESQSRRFGLLSQTAEGTETRIEELNSAIESSKKEIDRIGRVERDIPNLKGDYAQFHNIEKTLKQMRPVKAKYDRLNSLVTNSSTQAKTKETDLQRARTDLVEREEHLKSLKKEIPSVSEVSAIRRSFENLEEELRSIIREKARIEGELKGLKRGRTEVESNLAKVRGKSTCPICFQSISDPKEVLEHYSNELEENSRLTDECNA